MQRGSEIEKIKSSEIDEKHADVKQLIADLQIFVNSLGIELWIED